MCVFVMLCHFKGAFFPDSSMVQKIMQTPGNIIFSGNTPVRIMFVISGFVLAYKYFLDTRSDWAPDIIKRYIRLGLPCLVAILFAYMLMKFGLMNLFVERSATNIGRRVGHWLEGNEDERKNKVGGLL